MRRLIALWMLAACGSTPVASAVAADAACPIVVDAAACVAFPCSLMRCDGLMACNIAMDVCTCLSNNESCSEVPTSCSCNAGTPIAYYCEARSLCFCEIVPCSH